MLNLLNGYNFNKENIAKRLIFCLWLLFVLPLSFIVIQMTSPNTQGRWLVIIDIIVFSSCAAVFFYNISRSRGPLRWAIGFGAISMIISSIIQFLGFLVNIEIYSYSKIAPAQEALIYIAYLLGFIALALYFPIENFRFGGVWQVILSGMVVGLSVSVIANSLFDNIESTLQQLFINWSSNNETHGMITFIALDAGVTFSLSLLAMRLGYRLPVLIFLFLSMMCLIIGDITYWFCTGLFTPEIANQMALPMYMARRIIWALGVNYHVMKSPELKYNINTEDISLDESIMWIVLPISTAFFAFIIHNNKDQEFSTNSVILIVMSAIHLSFVIIDYRRVYRNLRFAQLNTTHANAQLTVANNALTETNVRLVETQQRLEQALLNAEDLAAERERARVASEIHDGLGGHLSTLKVHLEIAASTVEEDSARAAAAFAVAEEEAAAAQRELRRAVEALNAGSIAQPLDVLLAALARATEYTGLHATLAIHGAVQPLAQSVQHALYRIAQEALHNAQRHARATLVAIELDFRVAGEVQLRISDNGVGLPASEAAQPQGHGLRNMQNRVVPLGGALEITSQPYQGVSLWVTMPLTER